MSEAFYTQRAAPDRLHAHALGIGVGVGGQGWRLLSRSAMTWVRPSREVPLKPR